jgi:hypothetical protein
LEKAERARENLYEAELRFASERELATLRMWLRQAVRAVEEG